VVRRPRTSRRKELLAKWRSQRPCIHATDMRISCGERGVDASPTAFFRSPRAAENQLSRVPSPGVGRGRGRGIVFRNSRISLSAGRPADANTLRTAKPAIAGAVLLHYLLGLFAMGYERTAVSPLSASREEIQTWLWFGS
jgi:hypothetical protein